MNLTDLVRIINGRTKISYIDETINFIKLDSREISEGDIFICINSGTNYIDNAVNNKARAIITDKEINRNDVLVIHVNNIIDTLGYIGKYLRNIYKGKVIAITGSNGKTTTKELIYHILSSKYNVLKNVESENNNIGVPKTLLMLDNEYDYLVIELGMNHLGEIEYLSKMIEPDIGIITNIGTAHIGNLGSKENIFLAKSELLLGNPNMRLYINGEDKYLKRLNGINVLIKDYDGIFKSNHCPIDYVLAVKVCEDLGFSLKEIKEQLKTFKLPKSRMKEININNKIIIDDAYNASYESIIEALESLRKYNGRKIIILGDMLELGSFSKDIHEDIISIIKKQTNTLLFTLGEITRKIDCSNNFIDLEEIKNFFKNFSFFKGDVIYLKSSNKMKLYTIVPYFEELLK
jgi:UDP-N-acetylmuramyl pentapeptide synthase